MHSACICRRSRRRAEVKRQILDRYAGVRQVFVLTNRELKDYILRITDQWFALTSVQIAVAVLVAILGIVNTLTVSITDRRRELGVLRAVGGLHGQIRRTIWIEALSIAVLGLVLGFAFGAVNLYYILQIVHRDIAGMRLDLRISCLRNARVDPDDAGGGVGGSDLAGGVGGARLVG